MVVIKHDIRSTVCVIACDLCQSIVVNCSVKGHSGIDGKMVLQDYVIWCMPDRPLYLLVCCINIIKFYGRDSKEIGLSKVRLLAHVRNWMIICQLVQFSLNQICDATWLSQRYVSFCWKRAVVPWTQCYVRCNPFILKWLITMFK